MIHEPTKPNHNSDEHHFIQLLDTLPKVSVQGYDVHRRVIYWNKASTVIYGYDRSEALGHRLEDLIIPDEMRDEVIQRHQTWIKQGIPIPSSEFMLRHKAGHLVPVFSTHVMLKQHTNYPEMFCVDIDLSEQYAARRFYAATDKLRLVEAWRLLSVRTFAHGTDLVDISESRNSTFSNI
ncbi:PAS domain-containing protein [Vibrio cyclitrophicus]